MSKTNGKTTDHPRVVQLMDQYIQLRNKRRALAELDRETKTIQDKVGADLLDYLDESGQEAARTKIGTAYKSVKDYASCSDAAVFMEHVIHNNAFELLDRKPNATACRNWLTAQGSLPPGVKLNTVRSIRVLAAGEKETSHGE